MKNILPKSQIDAIQEWCTEYGIKKYDINSDGTINIHENVHLFDVPPVKINIVNGHLSANRIGFNSFENMPNIVNGNFSISNNYLTSLNGCPRYIDGDFHFSNNNLKTLKVDDYDVIVKGEIKCNHNNFPLEFLRLVSGYNMNQDGYPIGEIVYNSDLLRMILKYQRHYEIWNDNGLNKNNFLEFLDEVKDGLE